MKKLIGLMFFVVICLVSTSSFAVMNFEVRYDVDEFQKYTNKNGHGGYVVLVPSLTKESEMAFQYVCDSMLECETAYRGFVSGYNIYVEQLSQAMGAFERLNELENYDYELIQSIFEELNLTDSELNADYEKTRDEAIEEVDSFLAEAFN